MAEHQKLLSSLEQVMKHTQEAVETATRFRKEAEVAGATALAEFYGEVLIHNRQLSERAKALLAAETEIVREGSAPH